MSITIRYCQHINAAANDHEKTKLGIVLNALHLCEPADATCEHLMRHDPNYRRIQTSIQTVAAPIVFW